MKQTSVAMAVLCCYGSLLLLWQSPVAVAQGLTLADALDVATLDTVTLAAFQILHTKSVFKY